MMTTPGPSWYCCSGQALSRIVRLQVDDVVIDADRTLLRLAQDALEVPEPAATRLR